LADWEIRDTAD